MRLLCVCVCVSTFAIFTHNRNFIQKYCVCLKNRKDQRNVMRCWLVPYIKHHFCFYVSFLKFLCVIETTHSHIKKKAKTNIFTEVIRNECCLLGMSNLRTWCSQQTSIDRSQKTRYVCINDRWNLIAHIFFFFLTRIFLCVGLRYCVRKQKKQQNNHKTYKSAWPKWSGFSMWCLQAHIC